MWHFHFPDPLCESTVLGLQPKVANLSGPKEMNLPIPQRVSGFVSWTLPVLVPRSHGLCFCFLLFLFAGSTGCVVCHFLHTPLYLRVLEPSLWTSAFARLLSITVPSLHRMALSSSKVNGGWFSNMDDCFPLRAFLCLLTGTCIHFMSAEKL